MSDPRTRSHEGYRSAAVAAATLPDTAPRVSAIGPTVAATPAIGQDSGESVRAGRPPGDRQAAAFGRQTRPLKSRRPIGSRAQKGSPCVVPITAPHQASAAATRSSTVGAGASAGNWLA